MVKPMAKTLSSSSLLQRERQDEKPTSTNNIKCVDMQLTVYKTMKSINQRTTAALILLVCFLCKAQIIESTNQSSSVKNGDLIPNKFVQSSPPCLAAVCKDGVALLAVHTNIQTSPKTGKMNNENYHSSDTLSFPDLPLSSRCPLRIERLDDRGSALLTCGWRVDGIILAEMGRDLCSDELMRYGGTKDIGNRINKENDGYGQWLGWALVRKLVKYEAKDSTRSLSTIGLLATTNQNASDGVSGELRLIDTTGIINCRAYAIGKYSQQINKRLLKEKFEDLSVQEGAQLLLEVIRECSVGKQKQWDNNDEGDNESWELPMGTFVEIAIVDSNQKKFRRLRQPLLSISQ